MCGSLERRGGDSTICCSSDRPAACSFVRPRRTCRTTGFPPADRFDQPFHTRRRVSPIKSGLKNGRPSPKQKEWVPSKHSKGPHSPNSQIDFGFGSGRDGAAVRIGLVQPSLARSRARLGSSIASSRSQRRMPGDTTDPPSWLVVGRVCFAHRAPKQPCATSSALVDGRLGWAWSRSIESCSRTAIKSAACLLVVLEARLQSRHSARPTPSHNPRARALTHAIHHHAPTIHNRSIDGSCCPPCRRPHPRLGAAEKGWGWAACTRERTCVCVPDDDAERERGMTCCCSA